MKEYKLGYITNGYIIEVVAKTKQEKVDSFLNLIGLVNFEDSNNVIASQVDDRCQIQNTIHSSEDIRNEFKKVFESNTIDLTRFRNLIESGSELCNVKLLKVMERFFELFDYELYFSYEGEEFDRISRMICLVGIMEDKVHYLELGNALVGNTEVMRFVGKQNLVGFKTVIAKNKEYKLIDKIED